MVPRVDTPEHCKVAFHVHINEAQATEIFRDLPVQGISLLRRVHCSQLPHNHRILQGQG